MSSGVVGRSKSLSAQSAAIHPRLNLTSKKMAPRRSYGKVTEPIDPWLESQGLYRKHTARDGSCLFRAVSEQVFYTQSCHKDVRKQCVNFMQRHSDSFEQCIEGPFDEYLTRIQNPLEWGGQLEMKAMSLLYRRDIIVFQQSGKPPCAATNNGFSDTVLLCYSSDNHYDSVYSKTYISKAAFCQSLAYEVLYNNVFKLADVNYAVERMLHKTNRNRRDSYINQSYIYPSGSYSLSLEIPVKAIDCGLELNVKEQLAHGIIPFPYKVAKALDPDIYRNIEFDTWSDLKRELRLGILSGEDLQVGVKCLVKLHPDRIFHAHIQEMAPDKGPVIVFVEELGQKCTVPHEVLEPLPKNQRLQLTLPYRHHRQLASISQKPTLFTLSELGGKWKKSKLNKPRKVKEVLVPVNISPRLQCLPSSSSQHMASRFIHEQSHNVDNYSSENFNYDNEVSSMMEVGPVSSAIPASPTPAMMINVNSDGERDSGPKSPPPQADSTTPSPMQLLPTYVLCNGMEPQTKDNSGNLLLQPVNFMVQKSVQVNGSDLPLSDIPTLRFYYNLGHDYFHSNCMVWSNPVPQSPRMLPSSAVVDSTTNDHVLPGTTEDDAFQTQVQPLNPGVDGGPATPWQSSHGMFGAKMKPCIQEEHSGHPPYQPEQQVSGSTHTASPTSTINTLPTHPPYVQPYSPTMVPYYSIEPESVPYYTVNSMGSPVPILIPPQDLEMVPDGQPAMRTQAPVDTPYTFYSPSLAPVMFHQAPQTPMPRWVQAPGGVPQYM